MRVAYALAVLVLAFTPATALESENISACAIQPELRACAPFGAYSGQRLDTDVVDALPAGQWSDALKALFQQTRTVAKVPIRFTMQAEGFGFVSRTTEGYVIGIRPDLDHVDQESDIAHELYHAILQQQGYASQTNVPDGSSHWFNDLAAMITSCVDDAIIDERTSVLGFHPELLNRKRFEQFQVPADVQKELQAPIYMDGTALVIACDSARKGNGNQLLNRWALVSGEAAKRGEALRNKIGSFTCDGAAACNEKKKQIRDILGYPIQICNPLDGKWE